MTKPEMPRYNGLLHRIVSSGPWEKVRLGCLRLFCSVRVGGHKWQGRHPVPVNLNIGGPYVELAQNPIRL
jgi:hypothetical protein